MAVDWGSIRAVLNVGYGVGCWFVIPREHVFRDNGRLFAFDHGDRRVVLSLPLDASTGPNVTLFPRSTSVERGVEHPVHSHPDAPCKINRHGYVDLGVRVLVQRELLNEDSYCCLEPEDTGLLQLLEERQQL